MKEKEKDPNISTNDIRAIDESLDSTSSANNIAENKEMCKTDIRNISDEPVAPQTFFQNNKVELEKIIRQSDFFREIKDIYFANKPDVKTGGNYIGTSFSVEDEYMINKRIVINRGKFDYFISYSGYITSEGQNYLFDYFKDNSKLLKEKYNGRK